jgi:hypothetical protein
MFHYIYKTSNKKGKYYIGRHSTKELDDGYLGSGVWIRKIKNKAELDKIIIEFCSSYEELLEKEKCYISEHIDHPMNMNFNNSSVGAATGSLNVAHQEKVKNKTRERMLHNNPMKTGHTEESKEKIRQSMMGEKNHFYGKVHTEESKEKIRQKNSGKIWSEDQKNNLSEVRKKQFDGKRPSYLFFEKHSDESKEKMRRSALNRVKIECPHCHLMCSPNTAKRWHFNNCKRQN